MQAGALPREPLRVRHPQRPERPLRPPAAPPWDVTFAIQRATRQAASGRSSSSPAARAAAASRSPTAYTDAYPASVAEHYGHRVPRPARHRALAPHSHCPEATAAFYTQHRATRQNPAQARGGGRRPPRPTSPACIAEAGDPRVRAPAVLDDPGDRGPRGHPRLPRRRQARPLRRELRDPVRPDVRRAVPRAHPHALPRRPGRPHARRRHLLRGGRRAPSTTRSSRRSTPVPREPACAGRLRGPDAARRRTTRSPRSSTAAPIDYRLPDGRRDHASSGRSPLADLENAVVGYMYSAGRPDDPADAASRRASRDDLVPLARLAAAARSACDPDTLEAEPGPDPGPTPCTTRSSARTTSTTADSSRRRRPPRPTTSPTPATLGVTRDPPRRPLLRRHAVPVLAEPAGRGPASGGDRRPAVPDAGSWSPRPTRSRRRSRWRCASPTALPDVHVIIETGGPHVIFGWGLSCPDDVVADYLVEGKSSPRTRSRSARATSPTRTCRWPGDTRTDYPDGAVADRAVAREPGAEHQRLLP